MNDPLDRFPLLARLGPLERQALGEELEILDVGPGTLLFEEGDPAEGLLLVAEGRVRVRSRRSAEAAELGAGAALGAFSLALRGVREARAETTSRSRLLLLRRDAYERLAASAPAAACRLLEGVIADTASLLRSELEPADAHGASVDRGRDTD